MEDISLHILDIAENSIKAKAKNIKIKFHENTKKDKTILEIADDGEGMNKKTLNKALNPFFTTKNTRTVGLGLSLLSESAKAANGTFSIKSKPGKGTHLKAVFQTSHIDRKPMGDIASTLISIISGHPEVNLVYAHQLNGKKYRLNTKKIKSQLNGIRINSPEVLQIIKSNIKKGLDYIGRQK
ncbi:MAG: ATP-binding protein [Candidatus Aminicenantes bacterium]|nr:ATP-binding protein [Candidatus Aminicenantes bacterium]HHF52290.1 ATP-binding protein [Candidatus Aminicenantes bacterium]